MPTPTSYTFLISKPNTLNGKIAAATLVKEIAGSAGITIGLSTKKVSVTSPTEVVIHFKDILPGTMHDDFLVPLLAAHAGEKTIRNTVVSLDEERNSDGVLKLQHLKSYSDSSKSFTTPDYSSRQTWWFDTTAVVDETLVSNASFSMYSSNRTPKADWNADWILWEKIPNNARQSRPELKAVIKVNGLPVTSGYSINHSSGVVTFGTPLLDTDIVTASYHYANSSSFVLTPTPGKKLLVDYVETQFSANCGSIPVGCHIEFQAIYNGPALPADSLYPGFPGYPANTDLTLKKYEYHTGADFMNESTQAYVCEPFMELTQKQNILPWNYLTGHTLKPAGDPTTNIANNEFNKLKCVMVGDAIIPNCEIATGTFYCMVESL